MMMLLLAGTIAIPANNHMTHFCRKTRRKLVHKFYGRYPVPNKPITNMLLKCWGVSHRKAMQNLWNLYRFKSYVLVVVVKCRRSPTSQVWMAVFIEDVDDPVEQVSKQERVPEVTSHTQKRERRCIMADIHL